MGVRLTGFSTPIGGVSWEYPNAEKKNNTVSISPTQKIKVFISSICGKPRYDRIRKEIKEAIENTELAQVYLFEGEQASTISARNHYLFALEDSDVCIFFIDNKDGVTPSVQAEIDNVRKNNIQALYYFCDEETTDKTPLEQSLRGDRFAKSKTVHSFEEFSKDGAQGLIDDISAIYHNYCRGRLRIISENTTDELQKIKISDIENSQFPIIPKLVLDKVDKCKEYILKLTIGHFWHSTFEQPKGSSDIDEWCAQFLPIIFEGKTIKQFNTSMFLEDLKNHQTEEHYQVVETRWKAIQAYFLDDVEHCVDYLESALQLAKETHRPSWVINDILIDLRNQHWLHCTINNKYTNSAAQEELDCSEDKVYYPTLDRLHESLHEKYIDGLYKKKLEHPYTVTFGNNLSECGEMLASAYIVAMYNGSLTHIILIYDEIKRFLFYLSCRYNEWSFKQNLYKFSIYTGDLKEVNGIQNSFPEVLNNLTSADAAEIMNFCNNQPVSCQRIKTQLRAFNAIGCYLDDEAFQNYQKLIINEIKSWIAEDNPILDIGNSIFSGLSGAACRISQDILAEICCLFMDKHFSRWYLDMFKFMANCIDLQSMSLESAKLLINHLDALMDNKQEREQVQYAPSFLYVLRKQNPVLTESLDKKVSVYFSQYYNEAYKLELTDNESEVFPQFIHKYIELIKNYNKTQGENGVYIGYSVRMIATIRTFLISEKFICKDAKLMDDLIATVSDTLLYSKEGIDTKLDAISLLSCIIVKYPGDYNRNNMIYENLFKKQAEILANDIYVLDSNVDLLALQIALQFLYTAMGKDTYTEILELMPYIREDTTTTISVSKHIKEYLEISDTVVLPNKLEALIMQNVLQWLHSDNTNIRLYATKILLTLCRSCENVNIVNHQIIQLINSDNAYIKNLIMRNIYTTDGIQQDTKCYVVSKCENDANYYVRMVCKKERKHYSAKNTSKDI